LKVLDLFSGIGGFALGFHMADPKFETVGFVERDEYCQKILALRFPDVPIYNDIKTFDSAQFIGTDIVCGGFPCQPWSQAGRQKGAKDDRDLWPEMLRIIEAVRPRFVVGENVRGFVNEPLGLKRSVSDLESVGYESQAFIIPALSVDAKHRRDRCWIISVANTSITRPQRRVSGRKDTERKDQSRYSGCGGTGNRQSEPRWWPVEPNIQRISHGVPNRVDRLKCIGNSIVPAIAMHIGRAIIEASR
jgi:DNA (cytosine-5)-methyltransferase 1